MGKFISIAKNIIETAEQSVWHATNGDLELNASNQVKLRSVDKVLYDNYQSFGEKKTLQKFTARILPPVEKEATEKTTADQNKQQEKKEQQDDGPVLLNPYPSDDPHFTEHASYISGISLDLEIAAKQLKDDGSEIIFETTHPGIHVLPESININQVLSSKANKEQGATASADYFLPQAVNIKCAAVLQQDEPVKILVRLGTEQQEVGKLMLSKNTPASQEQSTDKQ